MGAQAEFATATGLTFAAIGIAILLMLLLQVWIIIKTIQTATLLVRVLKRASAAERSRREIQERDRVRIARMIRRKATDDEWAALLAELGEDPTQPKEK